jgi:hypothetical protein
MCFTGLFFIAIKIGFEVLNFKMELREIIFVQIIFLYFSWIFQVLFFKERQ